MVDKFAKLVVGYFIYGSARDTAMGIECGAKYLLDPEQYRHIEKRIKEKRRIM